MHLLFATVGIFDSHSWLPPLFQHLSLSLSLWKTVYVFSGSCHPQEQLTQVRCLALAGSNAATGTSDPRISQQVQKMWVPTPPPPESVATQAQWCSSAKQHHSKIGYAPSLPQTMFNLRPGRVSKGSGSLTKGLSSITAQGLSPSPSTIPQT